MTGADPRTVEMMDALQRAGYRMTSTRRAVVNILVGRRRPFSSSEILEEIQAAEGGVGRATVFRTLDVLQSLGMLDRVENPDGSHGYVVCHREHHHHAICSGCGLVVDLPGCVIAEDAERVAVAAGFALQGHRLEYYGLCSDCQLRGSD